MLDPILGDYSRNVPAARNAEVLSVTIALVVKLREGFAPHVPHIMDSVVRFTLEMISPNTHDFPEHRVLLFKLLQELVSVLPSMDPTTIKVIVDAVIFGFKHQQRDVSEPVRALCVSMCLPACVQLL
jgi:exportin-1